MIAKVREQQVKLRWVGAPPADVKRIALLIPQYNEEKNFDLERRLNYFRRLAWEHRDMLDVILIDDGSTDGSLNRIIEFCTANPGCFYFASVRPNAQKVGALYVVSAVIKHQYVILSDFDTDLVNLAQLEAFLDKCDADPTVMGCYFKMIPYEGQGKPFLFQQLEYSFARMYYKFHQNEQSVPVMPGAGSCFKREMLLQVYAQHSGFRNGEDREATVIGLKLGFKTMYVNSILALTRPPKTFKVLLLQRKRWYLGYIETVFKEQYYYHHALVKGKRIGLRTFQDAMGVGLLLLLPLEMLLFFLCSWKLAAGTTAGIYLLSVLYYCALFWFNPQERTELKWQHKTLLPLYPLFWLTVSFFAWWKAFLAFRPGKFKLALEENNMANITEQDVLVHYDWSAAVISEPFLGQVEYIRFLSNPAIKQEMPYLNFSIHLETIDRNAMEKSVAFFIKRHESLRTIFPVIDGEVKQVILPYDRTIFGVSYFEAATKEELTLIRKKAYGKAAAILSDLGKGPLSCCFLFKMQGGGYQFCLLVHHLICDAWSLRVIRKELADIYSAYLIGKEPALTPLSFQLKDYCHQQNAWLRNNTKELSLFWKNKLQAFDTLIDMDLYYQGYARRNNRLPDTTQLANYNDSPSLTKILDRPDGAVYTVSVGAKLFKGARMLARRNNCSVSAVMYAVFYLLNYIYTGRKHTLLALLIANRTKPEYRNLIGCILGSIYMPYELSELSETDEVIAQTFANLNEGIKHILYSHELLDLDAKTLRTATDFYMNYIFSGEEVNPAGDHMAGSHTYETDICYGINCMLQEYSNDLVIRWKYNTSLFSPELVEDVARCYEEILEYLVGNNNCRVKEVQRYLHTSQPVL